MRIAGKGHWLLLALLVCLAWAGCSPKRASVAFIGTFTQMKVSEAPAELQQVADEMKGAPGLYVLHSRGQSYLLIMAGRLDEPGWDLRVLDMQPPTGGEVRVLATLQPDPTADNYPMTVIQFSEVKGLKFKARLGMGDAPVLELRETPVPRR